MRKFIEKSVLFMDIEQFRRYCLIKKGVTEGFPFGEQTLVFKVMEKMFALISLDASPLQFNVKCDPELMGELRAKYSSVQPGYHMNKNHWNTVFVDRSIPEKELRLMIDHSYEQVVNGLSAKARKELLDKK